MQGKTTNRQKGGAKSGTTSGQNQMGQLCLQILKLSCFVFCGVLVFVGVFSEALSFFLIFGVKKRRVNKWSTVGSISGPRVASKILEADVDHLLTLDFCIQFLMFFFSKN